MKKAIRRSVSLMLILCMVLSTTIPVHAMYFSDISTSHWALDGINYVSDNGIMTGTASNVFSPNLSVTRAMMVTVIYRKAGSPSVSGSSGFSDVPSGTYYTKAVTWASQKGIVNGTANGVFSPNNNVTTQDAMVMLYRYAKYYGYETSESKSIAGFADSLLVSNYALPAMQWAVAYELLYGDTNNCLLPSYPISRVRLATVLTRFGTNTEGIINKVDNLSFNNYRGYFTNSSINNYYMTSFHINKLNQAIYNTYGYTTYANNYVSMLASKRSETWGGSCYGMSAVMILDKLGKIDFNKNFGRTSKMYDVSCSPGSSVSSAINYYHLTQYLPAVQPSSSNKGIYLDLQQAYNTIRNHHGLTLVTFFWNHNGSTGGHAIVVTGARFQAGYYYFETFDPNLNTVSEMKIDMSGLSATETYSSGGTTTYTNLTAMKTLTAFNGFSNFDIDGVFNNNPSTISTTSAITEIDSFDPGGDLLDEQIDLPKTETEANWVDAIDNFDELTMFMVDLYTPFNIQNGDGQSITWDGESLDGDMEIISTSLVPGLEDDVASLIIYVPKNKSYCFSPIKNETNSFSVEAAQTDVSFSIVDADHFLSVLGSRIDAIDVGETVTVDGDNSVCEINYASYDRGIELQKISGTIESTATIDEGVSSLNVVGIDNKAIVYQNTELE